jgi:hypothetical protein
MVDGHIILSDLWGMMLLIAVWDMSILHLNVLDHATTIMECDFDDELHW